MLPRLVASLLPMAVLALAAPACSDTVTRGDHDLGERYDESAATPLPASTATTMAAPAKEVCGNGLDDDANGRVDEGCPCAAGATQRCFAGAAALAGVGACSYGTQTCGAPSASGESKPGEWGACLGAGTPNPETCNGVDDDCNGKLDDVTMGTPCTTPATPRPDAGPPVDPALACTGTGLIWKTLGDQCIDDGGQSGEGDALEIYCVNKIARFCLSNEACPWRSGGSTSDAVTCSRAGLPATFLASARESCGAWQSHSRYCCSATGQISFTGC